MSKQENYIVEYIEEWDEPAPDFDRYKHYTMEELYKALAELLKHPLYSKVKWLYIWRADEACYHERCKMPLEITGVDSILAQWG